MAAFPKLFEPGNIGKLKLKNRLIKAPLHSSFCNIDGSVNDRLVRYFKEAALGGVGLIIVEYSYIDNKASKANFCQLSVADDEYLPGLALLASTIQENGAKAALQICHCGREKWLKRPPIKAPSRIPWEAIYNEGAPPPEELTFEEIVEIVAAFGDAALRVKKAGFDMVEVHGGHGYLVAQFLSALTNRRTDWYGGSLENRMRFLIEIVRNMRQKVGSDYPISVRLSGSDYLKGSITIEESIETAQALEKHGVNVIHVSGGFHHTTDKEIVPMYWPLAYHVWAAEAIKKAVSIPVIASGSLGTPQLGETVLAEGKADFISLARPFLADPFFARKAKEGRPEDIAPCIRCGECSVKRGHALVCTVNTSLGKEDDLSLKPAGERKKVLVVGGGPGGMEAARVAALRGHEVTLYEKRKLGGHLIEASAPEFKADLRRLIDYLSVQIRKLGVKVIEKEADIAAIKGSGTGAVVIATGSHTIKPDVPMTGKAIEAPDVLNGAAVGDSVIVVGGGRVGGETSLFLAEQGKKVTVIEMLPRIMPELGNRALRQAFFERLGKCGSSVTILTETRLEAIIPGGVTVSDKLARKRNIKADTVVLALGLKSDSELYDQVSKLPNLEVYAVGDCVEPRTIYDAIHEAYLVARNL